MNRYLRTTLVSAAMCAVTLHGPAARAQPATGEGYAPGARVLTIVRIPTPWYAPRFLVVRRMRESVPLYQSIDGLMHKAYSLSRPDGRFGGIYLWKDLASARAWFTPAWFERVEKERGARGDVAFFEVARIVEAGDAGSPSDGADQAAVAPLMLHLAAPLLTPLFGYFPGRALRMVGDLPAPAIRQWIRWCRHPEFAWGAEPDAIGPSLRSARFHLEAWRFTDDEAMTETSTRKLLDAMPNAACRLHVIDPAEFGLPAIGHAGAFRRQAGERLWPLFDAALRRACAKGRP